MTNLQRNLCIAIIVLAVLTLGYCKAHGESMVIIQFKTSEEIARIQDASPMAEQYRAKALTWYAPDFALIILPIDRPVDIGLIAHEWRHAQGEKHDSTGRWLTK